MAWLQLGKYVHHIQSHVLSLPGSDLELHLWNDPLRPAEPDATDSYLLPKSCTVWAWTGWAACLPESAKVGAP